MRSIVILSFLLLSCIIQAQSLKSDLDTGVIYYIVPENVECEIIDYLRNDSIKYPISKYYCYLSEVEDTITIMITSYQREEHPKIRNLLNLTNRYLYINDKSIPIIFPSDILLSNIINTRTKYDSIPVVETLLLIGGGYYIRFFSSMTETNGNIIEIGYAQ